MLSLFVLLKSLDGGFFVLGTRAVSFVFSCFFMLLLFQTHHPTILQSSREKYLNFSPRIPIRQTIHVLPTSRSVIVNFPETKENGVWKLRDMRTGKWALGRGKLVIKHRRQRARCNVAFSIAIGNKCRTTSAVYYHEGRETNVSTLLLPTMKNFRSVCRLYFVDLSSFYDVVSFWKGSGNKKC